MPNSTTSSALNQTNATLSFETFDQHANKAVEYSLSDPLF